ncbi:hypothetical protein EYF80_032417 [Liparis tanakae]|uniref:Uncharacterized protein n=1 Tax=Liparis tanakae TaxID=230148 RepID=A0A4Z2GVH0_9TELE|nr:hypothetical protein EYF80_032417 [Liparis tanakae]
MSLHVLHQRDPLVKGVAAHLAAVAARRAAAALGFVRGFLPVRGHVLAQATALTEFLTADAAGVHPPSAVLLHHVLQQEAFPLQRAATGVAAEALRRSRPLSFVPDGERRPASLLLPRRPQRLTAGGPDPVGNTVAAGGRAARGGGRITRRRRKHRRAGSVAVQGLGFVPARLCRACWRLEWSGSGPPRLGGLTCSLQPHVGLQHGIEQPPLAADLPLGPLRSLLVLRHGFLQQTDDLLRSRRQPLGEQRSERRDFGRFFRFFHPQQNVLGCGAEPLAYRHPQQPHGAHCAPPVGQREPAGPRARGAPVRFEEREGAEANSHLCWSGGRTAHCL